MRRKSRDFDMPAVLVISKDKDFAQPLAEQVKDELSVGCRITEAGEAEAATVVVTTEPGIRCSCPVITIENRPLRLSALLTDIEAALHIPAEEMVVLGNGCLLKLRQKQLFHASSGRALDVTDMEAKLLQVLAGKKEGIGKEKLLKEVWGIEAELNTHTLETHVYRLRAKFRELMGDEAIIASAGRYGLGV